MQQEITIAGEFLDTVVAPIRHIYVPKAVKKVLAKNDGAGYEMLEYLLSRFDALTNWTGEPLERCIESACEERDTSLGNVAQPVRVAITGSTISPSIHESLAMLGKDHTIMRIARCLAQK